MEDYSNFSWEAIQKSLQDIIEDIKKKTGASDIEIDAALAVCAKKFMEVNCFELKGEE